MNRVRATQVGRSTAALGAALALIVGAGAAWAGLDRHDQGSGFGRPADGGRHAVPAEGAESTRSAASVRSTGPAPSATVTLITGDRVRVDVSPDGAQRVTVQRSAMTQGERPIPTAFTEFASGEDHFVVPNTAVPFLGTTLDPQLFNVSYLVRAGYTDEERGTLPIQVTGADASAGGDLPAVRLGSDGSATVTKADAHEFGELLAAQWHNSSTGVARAPSGRLSDIDTIRLAPSTDIATSAPPTARARGLKFHTVTLRFIDRNGDPASAIGMAQNVADALLSVRGDYFRVGDIPVLSGDGEVSVKVADGVYALSFSVLTPNDGSSLGADASLVVLPQVAVRGDRTITLDARTAKPYHADLTTPMDADYRRDILSFSRASAQGGRADLYRIGSLVFRLLADTTPAAASTVYATPTKAETRGRFGFTAYSLVESGPGEPNHFLNFPTSDRIPTSLTHTIAPDRLTKVVSHVYGGVAEACGVPSEVYFDFFQPWGTYNSAGSVAPPGERVDYVYSGAPQVDTFQTELNADDCTRRRGEPRTLVPGSTITETWNKAPQVPAPIGPNRSFMTNSGDFNGGAPLLCAACRQADIATLYLMPSGDSSASHSGSYQTYGETERSTTRLRYYSGGVLALASDPDPQRVSEITPFALQLPMRVGPARYQLDWTQTPTGDLQSSTRTIWRFESGRGDAGPTASSRACAPDPARGCSYLPLLFPRYDLPLDVESHAPAAGDFAVAFDVLGQRGAPQPGGVSASMSVSYDDGTTWSEPVPASGDGHGGFTTSITHPALADTSGFVSLRLHAQDRAGSSVDQTIVRAYALTSTEETP